MVEGWVTLESTGKSVMRGIAFGPERRMFRFERTAGLCNELGELSQHEACQDVGIMWQWPHWTQCQRRLLLQKMNTMDVWLAMNLCWLIACHWC